MEADTTVTLYNFYGWLHANKKGVAAGTVLVVVVAGIVGAVVWNNNAKEADASQALMAVPSLLGDAPPGDSAAAKTFEKISQDFSGTTAGGTAELLAARELFLAGKYPEAQQQFSSFVNSHPGNTLVPQANVGIAACLEAEGKIGDAVQQYKRINTLYSSSPNIMLPVKLTLGRLSEADNKPDQAVGYYNELANLQDPNDPWVIEAAERLRLLVAKHPELNPRPPQSRAAAPTSLMAPSAAETQLMAPPGSTAPATNQSATPH